MRFDQAPMPARAWGGVLVVHSSSHGETASAARRMAASLLHVGLDVELRDTASARDIDPDHHDVIVVGAGLTDPERREMSDWVVGHHHALADRPTALFTVCAGNGGSSPDERRSVRRALGAFVAETAWMPARSTVIADTSALDRFADEVAIIVAAPLAA